jgi:hypothetical protein
MKKQIIIVLLLLSLPLMLFSQPATNPSTVSKGLPNWTGAFVVALIVGAIIFSILKGIGSNLTWKTGKPVWKRLFTYLALIIWLIVFVICLKIL